MGSTSYWNSSNSTPTSSPVRTSPRSAPAIGPATIGRAIMIWGTLTRSRPTRVPHASSSSCTSRLTRTPGAARPGQSGLLGGDLDASGREPAQLLDLGVAQVHVAQPLGASGSMVDPAEVDPIHLVAV